MRWAAGIAAAGGVAVAAGTREAALAGLPLVLLWALSPLIARRVSRAPAPALPQALSPAVVDRLRRTARRTWRFFETFVGAEDHGLPPDNFQEDPDRVVAHRTSPTNIGIYLLSTVAARDLGWIGARRRSSAARRHVRHGRALAQFRGHLFNWYDTGDLHPLEPRYVSTVDSGNLAGHLLAPRRPAESSRRVPSSGPEAIARSGRAPPRREAAATRFPRTTAPRR